MLLDSSFFRPFHLDFVFVSGSLRLGLFAHSLWILIATLLMLQNLVLVGVFCSGSPDGTDPYAEVALQPLPEYTIPSDGVTMTCITCTDKGHVFLAGHDGHIYELQYTTGSGWNRRCGKVCLTTAFSSVVSRWIVPNVFKFGAVDSIVEMVFDNERDILYARTEDMKLQVFELGLRGDGPLWKVAEEKKYVQ